MTFACTRLMIRQKKGHESNGNAVTCHRFTNLLSVASNRLLLQCVIHFANNLDNHSSRLTYSILYTPHCSFYKSILYILYKVSRLQPMVELSANTIRHIYKVYQDFNQWLNTVRYRFCFPLLVLDIPFFFDIFCLRKTMSTNHRNLQSPQISRVLG